MMPTRVDTAHGATIPMTRSQSLIWTGQALAPHSPLYNMAWRFDISGAIDPDLFSQAFDHVARSSDALRLAFPGPSSPGVGHVLPRPPALVRFLDLSAHDDPEAEARVWTEARAKDVLDLAAAAYDTALLRVNDESHVWFLNQHHLITDAWSARLLFRAVSDTYETLIAGREPGPTEAPGFGDHARAEAHARESGALDPALRHWAAFAQDATIASALYGDAAQREAGASERVGGPLEPDLLESLKALAQATPFRLLNPDLSVFAILATAYAALLARVTGDRLITLASPSHNRPTPDDRATMGLFIEMFPLRVTVEDDDTFTSLHKRLTADVFSWLKHAQSGCSSAESVKAASAVLNFIPIPFGDFAGISTHVEWLHPSAHDAGHDIRLHATSFNGAETLDLRFDLKRQMLNAAARARVPGHFRALLAAFIGDPDNSIWEVALASDGEPVADLSGAPGGAAIDVVAAFREQARQTPDRTAVRQGATVLDYRTFDEVTDRVAGGLATRGVAPGDIVLIFGRRSVDVLAAIWGTLKAGATFVPVPADTPPARLAQIADQARPALVMADPVCRAAAEGLGLPLAELADAQDGDHLPSDVPTNTLAYTIFTSGTTGAPKGVSVARDQFARYIHWAARSYIRDGRADFAFCSSIGFDLTLTSMFVPLVSGGTVVVYPEAASGPDLAVLDAFEEDAVHVVKLTPSHLALLCEAGATIRNIDTLILGGESLSTEQSRRASQRLSPSLRIFNEYGPTEAVVGCMIHAFDADADRRETVPIGVPADGVRIAVLDRGGNPQPLGVTGEIHIGGTRLAEGYMNHPDLTEDRFAEDGLPGGGRAYRTGDLARLLPSGALEYLGRDDRQIKVGGVRVEPSEIEATLTRVPGVTSAVVGMIEDGAPTRRQPADACARCGLSSDHPDCVLGADGICDICRGFDSYRDKAQVYFSTPQALRDKVAGLAGRKTGRYDAILLLSGGKDSTYALYRLAELTPNILALTLDNGFISDGAKANIRRAAEALGVEHRFMSTEAMNEIFVDSLKRHSNVCNGCFKTIYTLALQIARAEGIPAIVTGLSRGQFFETRLTPELFDREGTSATEIDRTVAQARRAYHKTPDAVTRLIDAPEVVSGTALDAVEFIDIYRYLDVPLNEIYRFLSENAPWIRPEDTGRSTNCLINDVGIFVHKRREGFHNYALPYSWDVRMGHKTRGEAVEELDDAIDPRKVQSILDRIGYDEDIDRPPSAPRLVAWVVAEAGLDLEAVRKGLAERLPRAFVPTSLIPVEAFPLTANGKVDVSRLPRPKRESPATHGSRAAPATSTEHLFLRLWESVLRVTAIGVLDNFYDLGGDSIAAIQIAARAQGEGLPIAATDVFEHQTIRALSACATDKAARRDAAAPVETEDAPLIDLSTGDLAALSKALKGAR